MLFWLYDDRVPNVISQFSLMFIFCFVFLPRVHPTPPPRPPLPCRGSKGEAASPAERRPLIGQSWGTSGLLLANHDRGGVGDDEWANRWVKAPTWLPTVTLLRLPRSGQPLPLVGGGGCLPLHSVSAFLCFSRSSSFSGAFSSSSLASSLPFHLFPHCYHFLLFFLDIFFLILLLLSLLLVLFLLLFSLSLSLLLALLLALLFSFMIISVYYYLLIIL